MKNTLEILDNYLERAVAKIMEATDFSRDTVYPTIRAYKNGGMAALKPRKRGRKMGEKRTLSPEQEKELIGMLVDHHPEQVKHWLEEKYPAIREAAKKENNAYQHGQRHQQSGETALSPLF